MFFDAVLIDEFQDFRESDYEVIIRLAKLLTNVILVGDYNQHSVSGLNNAGKPFKKGKSYISFSAFVEVIRKAGFEVDTKTLSKSRRCSAEVCDYISQKLGIDIMSTNDHIGKVIWADSIANEVLRNNDITKLVYSDASKYSFPALNWSYSKGDTLACACVILTKDFENLAEEDFSVNGLAVSTLNKLYVAMTRSRSDLFLIKQSTFRKLRDLYL